MCAFVSCSDKSNEDQGKSPTKVTKSDKPTKPAPGKLKVATKPPKPNADKTAKKSPTKTTKPIEVYKPGGFHLDDGKVEYYRPDRRHARRRPTRRASRRIYINLVSTPPGATASIDGQSIGSTPTYWEGPATGKPRNFTFVLPGYVMQQYRFVPVTSGTVHAPLKKMTKNDADAGVPASAKN